VYVKNLESVEKQLFNCYKKCKQEQGHGVAKEKRNFRLVVGVWEMESLQWNSWEQWQKGWTT